MVPREFAPFADRCWQRVFYVMKTVMIMVTEILLHKFLRVQAVTDSDKEKER